MLCVLFLFFCLLCLFTQWIQCIKFIYNEFFLSSLLWRPRNLYFPPDCLCTNGGYRRPPSCQCDQIQNCERRFGNHLWKQTYIYVVYLWTPSYISWICIFVCIDCLAPWKTRDTVWRGSDQRTTAPTPSPTAWARWSGRLAHFQLIARSLCSLSCPISTVHRRKLRAGKQQLYLIICMCL